MKTLTVHGNPGRAPLVRVSEHVWEARVTIAGAGTYEGGSVWTEDGRALEFRMTWPQTFTRFGLLHIVLSDGDAISADLRRELFELAA